MPKPDSPSAWASEDTAPGSTSRLLLTHPTFRHVRALTTPARLRTRYMGCRITGTGSHSAMVTKLRRALTTASMTTTGEVLLAVSNKTDSAGLTGVEISTTNKTETEGSTRVEISAARTTIIPKDLSKIRRAILGRIKIRIKTAGIATVQTAKTTAKETVTPTDPDAASKTIG